MLLDFGFEVVVVAGFVGLGCRFRGCSLRLIGGLALIWFSGYGLAFGAGFGLSVSLVVCIWIRLLAIWVGVGWLSLWVWLVVGLDRCLFAVADCLCW